MKLRINLRLIDDACYREAFAVLQVLRETLTYDVFVERLHRQQNHGYELHGAFADSIVGLVGFRPVETMARGYHMHLDDLVVVPSHRAHGIGEQLLAYAEATARRRKMAAVFLDSRQEVIEFYSKRGYIRHTATLLRKTIDTA